MPETWGTGLSDSDRGFVCHVVLVLVDATWRRVKLRFSFNPRLIAPAKPLLVPSRVFALQLQKAISFQPLGRFG